MLVRPPGARRVSKTEARDEGHQQNKQSKHGGGSVVAPRCFLSNFRRDWPVCKVCTPYGLAHAASRAPLVSPAVAHVSPEIPGAPYCSRCGTSITSIAKNDPYGEHDFGSLEIDGERFFFT
jgi:hypothetical protein